MNSSISWWVTPYSLAGVAGSQEAVMPVTATNIRLSSSFDAGVDYVNLIYKIRGHRPGRDVTRCE
jgi:hypothetical protein